MLCYIKYCYALKIVFCLIAVQDKYLLFGRRPMYWLYYYIDIYFKSIPVFNIKMSQ